MEKSLAGLLFHLSGETGFTADYSGGCAEPTFCSYVDIIEDGAVGNGIQCDNYQKLAYKAPGNIYANRGTLGFFWRSRYPVGPTEFPIFRVGYCDHTSWDACWLRIDYNGSGFEAFITDINLSRARVCVKVNSFPEPAEWVHLALSWDEAWGIRFYVNGILAAEEYRPGVYSAGLDQFGPHSRIISHWNVTSDYNYIRGGDIDEIAIYDHMLTDDEIAVMASGKLPITKAFNTASLNSSAIRDNWLLRCGFSSSILPPAIPDCASIRKVEIHEAFDHKRWYWKALDGIRETTWPGVFNRSRLKGRNDYFQLPDWDCYSVSGKQVTFTMPPEPYNHIEISGSAHGTLELCNDSCETLLFKRPNGQERTVHSIESHTGDSLRFTNDEIEEPIGDFSVFYVTQGKAPNTAHSISYKLRSGFNSDNACQNELADYIRGRYQPYERGIMLATNSDTDFDKLDISCSGNGLPFVNIIVPYSNEDVDELGLDGIELELPAMTFCSNNEHIAFSVQIKDPLWYPRNLAHFSFTAEQGHAKKLWFDLRDRLLPKNRCLYITIACAQPGFSPKQLEGANLRLILQPAEYAKIEHIADRFTQVRDCYSHMVEEQPGLPEFNLYNRFLADITSLLEADPNHKLAQYYYYDKMVLSGKYKKDSSKNNFVPDYQTDRVPDDVPEWAYKQVEYLRHYKHLVNFYIDNRQIENGEFGGGLSDDGDFTSMWVGLANMGCNRTKVIKSHLHCLEAFYEQGMFTNGLPSIQSDELHSAEEGLIALGQALTLDFANPCLLERAMETARSIWWLSGVNEKGSRLIKSSYYSGSKMATEWPWNIQRPYSPLAISPAAFIVRYNGNEKLRKIWVELADSLLTHCDENGVVYPFIRFDTDEMVTFAAGRPREIGVYILLYTAYRFTGDKKYLDAIPGGKQGGKGNMFADGLYTKFTYNTLGAIPITDKTAEAAEYEKLNFTAGVREYYNTHGHPWIDRVYFDPQKIQYDRLGGVSHKRASCVYPMNRIRWEFFNESDDEKLAILSPCATDELIKLVVYNLSGKPVEANIIGFEVAPGKWRVQSGIDTNNDDRADKNISVREINFERSVGFTASFAPKAYTIITMERISAALDYWQRHDLGISHDDVRFYAHGMNVRIHSLGAVASPACKIALKNKAGEILKLCDIPPIDAPTDLWPRYWDVIFNLHGIPSLDGCYLEIDPEHKFTEITRENNIVYLQKTENF